MKDQWAAFICQSAGLGLVFLAQVAIAHSLGVNSYGVFAYVNAWLVALGTIARLGLDSVVLRDAGVLVSKLDWGGLKGLLRLTTRYTLTIGAVIAVLLMITIMVFVPSNQSELRFAFLAGALVIPMQALSSVRSSALLALGRVWGGFAPDYLIRPVVLGVSVLAMAQLLAIFEAAHSMIAVVLASAVALAVGQRILASALPAAHSRGIDSAGRTQLFRSALTLLLFNGMAQILHQIDTIVVGTMIHPHEAGPYYAAKQLALVASLALIALQVTAAPAFAALRAKEDIAGLQGLLRTVALRGFAFSMLFVIVVSVAGTHILRIFGAEFENAYPILVILAIGQLCAAAGGPVGQLVAMADLQIVGGSIYVCAAIAFIALAAIIVPLFGTVGAAISAVCVTCAWVVALNIVVWRKLGVVAAIVPWRLGEQSKNR